MAVSDDPNILYIGHMLVLIKIQFNLIQYEKLFFFCNFPEIY